MGKRKSVLDDQPYFDDFDYRGSSSKKSFGKGTVLDLGYSSYKGSSSSYKLGPRCYESHPALKLPGTDLVIYGGSCSNPVVKDADVYIGFDHSMNFTQRHWPWKKGTELLFKITDMRAPDNPAEFKKLVAWTRKQLEAGLKVHCGCIGGHGRTGTFLAALVSDFGETDAIEYVRKHYCQKAVESTEQVKFLQEHFGIKAAKGAKSYGTKSIGKSSPGKSPGAKSGGHIGKVYEPIVGMGSIWG